MRALVTANVMRKRSASLPITTTRGGETDVIAEQPARTALAYAAT